MLSRDLSLICYFFDVCFLSLFVFFLTVLFLSWYSCRSCSFLVSSASLLSFILVSLLASVGSHVSSRPGADTSCMCIFCIYIHFSKYLYLYLDTFVQNGMCMYLYLDTVTMYLNFHILFRNISDTMYITHFAGHIPLVNCNYIEKPVITHSLESFKNVDKGILLN